MISLTSFNGDSYRRRCVSKITTVLIRTANDVLLDVLLPPTLRYDDADVGLKVSSFDPRIPFKVSLC